MLVGCLGWVGLGQTPSPYNIGHPGCRTGNPNRWCCTLSQHFCTCAWRKTMARDYIDSVITFFFGMIIERVSRVFFWCCIVLDKQHLHQNDLFAISNINCIQQAAQFLFFFLKLIFNHHVYHYPYFDLHERLTGLVLMACVVSIFIHYIVIESVWCTHQVVLTCFKPGFTVRGTHWNQAYVLRTWKIQWMWKLYFCTTCTLIGTAQVYQVGAVFLE